MVKPSVSGYRETLSLSLCSCKSFLIPEAIPVDLGLSVASGLAMRIFEAVRAENKKILKLLRKLDDTASGVPDERRRLTAELKLQFESLAEATEEYLYPLFINEPTRYEAIVGRAQRRESEDLLHELERYHPSSKQFKRLAEVLSGQMRKQIEHEDRVLLPQAEKIISGEDAEAMGERLRQRKAAFIHDQRHGNAP